MVVNVERHSLYISYHGLVTFYEIVSCMCCFFGKNQVKIFETEESQSSVLVLLMRSIHYFRNNYENIQINKYFLFKCCLFAVVLQDVDF